MVSVGYGEFHAWNTHERLYAAFVILGGSIMFGAIITKVTKLILNRNPQVYKFISFIFLIFLSSYISFLSLFLSLSLLIFPFSFV